MIVRKRLGEILVKSGRITQAQLDASLEESASTGKRLGEILIGSRLVSIDDLGRAMAEQFEVPYETMADISPQPEALEKATPATAKSYKMLPLTLSENSLVVAMAYPDDLEAMDWLQVRSGVKVEPRFALPERVDRAVAFYYGIGQQETLVHTEAVIVDSDEDLDSYTVETMKRASQEAPVIQLVNDVLAECVTRGTSDIHFEPQRQGLDVRIRVDGILKRIRSLPPNLQPAILSRLKIMAEMDISQRRMPQDGRISIKTGDRRIDIRVNCFPTKWGERLVLRFLDKASVLRSLNELDMSPINDRRFRSSLSHPHGLILVTGPTGSGKTTTLYAAVQELNNESVNILTCEDPIEYEVPGIGQSQVHESIGLTFAGQLRAALRQDPDILLVGEIRDMETAEVVARAAMTGQLVLSTLHTNDAAGAIPRLIDMEVEPFLINSSLIAVTAQRLMRRLCPECKIESRITPSEIDTLLFDPGAVWRPLGCPHCNDLGYRGRLGIHEVLLMDEELRQLTLRRESSAAIHKAAVAHGMVPLLNNIQDKVRDGLVSPEEAMRFLGSAQSTFDVVDDALAA